MTGLLDPESLLPQLILGVGLAVLVGNGLAWWKHRRGETPKGVDRPAYRPGRVGFLLLIGLVMTIWALLSLSRPS